MDAHADAFQTLTTISANERTVIDCRVMRMTVRFDPIRPQR